MYMSKSQFDNTISNLVNEFKTYHKGEDINDYIYLVMTDKILSEINPYDLICEMNKFTNSDLCPNTLKSLKTRIVDAIALRYEQVCELKPVFERGDLIETFLTGKKLIILSYDKKFDNYTCIDGFDGCDKKGHRVSREYIETYFKKIGFMTEDFLESIFKN